MSMNCTCGISSKASSPYRPRCRRSWACRQTMEYSVKCQHSAKCIVTSKTSHKTVTRDEWNNLLCLLNISHFSSLCCAKNFSLCSCTERMAKRMQKTIGGKQDCGEIQANGDEPHQFCLDKFFDCEQSDCVEKPGDTQSFKSTSWIIKEACCGKRKSKFQLRRSVEFSRMAKRCSTFPLHRETCGN